MINSAQKDRVIEVLKKYNLKKQKMADLYIEDGSNIAADLSGKEPKVGVWIVDKVQTENRGVLRVQDIVNEVAAAMKLKSSASEQKGSDPASGGIDKASELKNRTETSKDTKPNDDVMNGAIPGESKLGAGDTSQSSSAERQPAGTLPDTNAGKVVTTAKRGTPDNKSEVNHENNSNINTSDEHNCMTGQPRDREIKEKGGQESPLKNVTATCEGCSTKMQDSIVEFQEIEAKYNGIYCPDCVTRGKYLEKAKTPEASVDQKVARNVPATPVKPDAKATVIKTCSVCGLELSGARALECFEKDPQKPRMVCEGCEDGGNNMNEDTEENLIQSDMELLNQKKGNLPAKKKQEFVVGTCEAVAVQYGVPVELTKLFFMTMDGGLYIKNPGLLYLAKKIGYSRIEVTTTYDEKAQEWSAECKIYPKLTKDILEGIARLDKDIQKVALDFATQPTNGTGRASKQSVRMSTMHAFLKEMAQTRAQNRALRAFTGYGGTSAEELPEAQLERD